jgi:hypothetical protein
MNQNEPKISETRAKIMFSAKTSANLGCCVVSGFSLIALARSSEDKLIASPEGCGVDG